MNIMKSKNEKTRMGRISMIQRVLSNSSSSFSRKSSGMDVKKRESKDCRLSMDKLRPTGRLNTSLKGFLNDIGCIGTNTLSKAVSNDIAATSSFVVLSGICFLNLGECGKSAQDKMIEEACERWVNRMELCMSLGTITYEKDSKDAVEGYRFDFDHSRKTKRDESSSSMRPRLEKKIMPRVSSRNLHNVNISANNYLPRKYVVAINLLTVRYINFFSTQQFLLLFTLIFFLLCNCNLI